MEFLKAILGEELYAQFEQAVNAYNGNEANKDKQIKVGNLGGGDYVSKGKYTALETENQTNITKLTEANNLIEQMKKATKDDEALQSQVTAYQQRVQELETELEKARLENAVKVELLSAKALDVDYLAFKLREKGELALDETGKIKGWEDKLAALKTQFPTQFEGEGRKEYDPFKLKDGDGGTGGVPTKEQFKSMTYEERLALKQKNEQLYKQLKN